ncbi:MULTISPECIES: gluconolaconase [unclassified Stenotrophomonas]|uniref:gluconolaconase n=1 Tax=unclassified Stenotrophomonas TaxID=196198 RepID=UPI001783A17B|nr:MULTISPECIES: gluconolaconase [unclassified Stenotrophomonas]MBD8644219.1 gluconolaconase [Stenotrophomonas sp. CFBP 13724]MDY1033647.1 gluconolaconase [Stenotrophomonas sp. CFBP8980]
MVRVRWIIGVAAVTTLAVAATFLPRPVTEAVPAGPAPTPLGWTAQLQPLAGDGVPGLRDGAPAQARFSDPYALLALDDGGLLVADAGDNNRIRRIAADGSVSTLAGSSEGLADGSALQARFHTPSGLARDAAGAVYVADTGNHAIRRIGLDGQVTTLAGGTRGFADGPAAQARFDGPMGVAVDALGNVYVADTWNDRIRVISLDGVVRTLAGGGEPAHIDGFPGVARFDTPVALAWDGDGALLVADFHNNAIRRVGMDGQVDTLVPSSNVINGPLSLARSHDGVLYVGDRSGRIVQVSAQGHQIALVGTGQVPRLARPSGLAVAADGSLRVADAAAWRLHRVAALDAGQAPAPARVGPADDAPLPRTEGRWPLAPQQGWHEVVGTLGEVRGNFKGESRHHLHDGFDVRGDVGQTVLAIADGKIDSPLSSWTVGGQAEGLEVGPLRYLHMRVGRDPRGVAFDERWQQLFNAEGKLERIRLRRGTRIHAGDRLGSINSQAHVHLSVGSSGFQRNAALLGFNGFVDSVAPRITDVALLDDADQPLRADAQGRVPVSRSGRGVQIVVEAWDQVDGNLPRRRLGLYQVGYQIRDAAGQPLAGYEQPRWNIVFNRMPPQQQAVRVAYAPDSGITVHGSAVTRFRYLATNTVRDGLMAAGRWQAAALPPGEYVIRAHARDHSGNDALGGRDLRVVLVD